MKNLFKTKTFWTGVGSVLSGVGFIITGSPSEGVTLIFQGFGMIFLRSAVGGGA